MPFLAHATMEPLNCTVHVTPDSCEVWVGSQVLARAQKAAAKATGLPLEKVIVHNHLIGGGFGRRLETDYVDKAVRIAKKVDGPVKVVYTREEDIRHDIYRPVYRDVMSASIAERPHRRLETSHHRLVDHRALPAAAVQDDEGDRHRRRRQRRRHSVRHSEPAHRVHARRAAGRADRLLARRRPEQQRVRDRELHRRAGAERPARIRSSSAAACSARRRVCSPRSTSPPRNPAGASPLPARVGRGIAAQVAFASFIATVIEAEVRDDGSVKLRRIVCAVDTGIAVNPDTIVAQLQGGLVFGLSAALWGEITIDKGRVQQSNFNDYRVLRIDEVPNIEVHVIASGEAPGGIGETGTTAGPPALGNAIYAATGVRLRRMPIDRAQLATRKPS